MGGVCVAIQLVRPIQSVTILHWDGKMGEGISPLEPSDGVSYSHSQNNLHKRYLNRGFGAPNLVLAVGGTAPKAAKVVPQPWVMTFYRGRSCVLVAPGALVIRLALLHELRYPCRGAIDSLSERGVGVINTGWQGFDGIPSRGTHVRLVGKEGMPLGCWEEARLGSSFTGCNQPLLVPSSSP